MYRRNIQQVLHDSEAIRKEAFAEVVFNNNEWFELLKKALAPVRREIIDRESLPEFSDLSTEPLSRGSYSIKLRILISMLCNNYSRTNNLSRPLETVCQLIEMHSKKFTRPSRQDDKIGDETSRISRERESQIPQILTLKL